MTTDLWMLVATAVFSIVWVLFYANARAFQPGGMSYMGSAIAIRPLKCPPGFRAPSGRTRI